MRALGAIKRGRTLFGCLAGALALTGCATPLIANIPQSGGFQYAAGDADALLLGPYIGDLIQVVSFGKLNQDHSQIVGYLSLSIDQVFTDSATGLKERGSRAKPGDYVLLRVLEGNNGVSSRLDCPTDKAVVFEIAPGRVNVFDGADAIRARAEQKNHYDPAAAAKTVSDARIVMARYTGVQAPVELVRVEGFVKVETRPASVWTGVCNKFYGVKPWSSADETEAGK